MVLGDALPATETLVFEGLVDGQNTTEKATKGDKPLPKSIICGVISTIESTKY
jgi:hypothetical protein